MRKLLGKRLLTVACAMFGAVLLAVVPMDSVQAQTTGVVSVGSAKVRKEASTGSEVVAGVAQGSVVTIVDEIKDSAGKTWYKVTVENKTGYIRSDLMSKSGGSSSGGSSSAPAATQATPIAATKAYINYESVRVRSGASTSHETKGSIVKNTSVTIVGEAKSSDGKKWYEIEYNNPSGKAAKGFVRADLVTVGEPPAPPQAAEPATEAPEEPAEEVPAETPAGAADESGQMIGEAEGGAAAAEEAGKPDYEMVFTANPDGVEEWYLYDNITNTRQTLSGLMEAANLGAQLSQNPEKEAPAWQLYMIIGLAVALLIALIVITLLAFKVRDLCYDDYMYEDDEEIDEEDEEDEEEAEPVYEEVKPLRRAKASVPKANMPKANMPRTIMPVTYKSEPPVEAAEAAPVKRREAEPAPAPSPQPRRKTKNFLIEDDEFEFEFLNIDD